MAEQGNQLVIPAVGKPVTGGKISVMNARSARGAVALLAAADFAGEQGQISPWIAVAGVSAAAAAEGSWRGAASGRGPSRFAHRAPRTHWRLDRSAEQAGDFRR